MARSPLRQAPAKLLLLPGASGDTRFWGPVSRLLKHPAERAFLGWPGFGTTPPDPSVQGLDDLVARVLRELDQPCALLAQSMGGVIALRAALQRPERVTHLVLAVTSGGIDVGALGAEDWRPAFFQSNPTVPRWFGVPQPDLTQELRGVHIPTLLLWGDADPISPVAVGAALEQLLPHATLQVLRGGGHGLVHDDPAFAARHIEAHLRVG